MRYTVSVRRADGCGGWADVEIPAGLAPQDIRDLYLLPAVTQAHQIADQFPCAGSSGPSTGPDVPGGGAV